MGGTAMKPQAAHVAGLDTVFIRRGSCAHQSGIVLPVVKHVLASARFVVFNCEPELRKYRCGLAWGRIDEWRTSTDPHPCELRRRCLFGQSWYFRNALRCIARRGTVDVAGVVFVRRRGYGRGGRLRALAGKPAAVLLHLGPGLANGLANLHNARRASTPIFNVVGDQATYHLQYDAPLTSDLAGFARPVSHWLHESKSARGVAADTARAVQAARSAPGGIATLILPADTAWNEAGPPARALPNISPAPASSEAIASVAALLRNGKRSMLLLRGAALRGEGLGTAGRIAAHTGARLACDTFAPHAELGAGRVPVERIPHFAEQIIEFMSSCEQLILVGAKPPVSFFTYPGKPSWGTPERCVIAQLAQEHEDGAGALSVLADAIGASRAQAARLPLALPELPRGPLNAMTVAREPDARTRHCRR
jgi:acetolactate synthase I/II/III large subunit